MKRYESKQRQILLPAEQIYLMVSNLENLTPAVGDKVEQWSATPDSCSFKAKGFTVKLKIDERVESKLIKVVADQGNGVPVDFAFWIQLHSVAPYDTRFRLVLDIELNMVMKMMVGGKLQEGLDHLADGIATAFAQTTNR